MIIGVDYWMTCNSGKGLHMFNTFLSALLQKFMDCTRGIVPPASGKFHMYWQLGSSQDLIMKHCPRLLQYSRTYSRHGNIHHVYEAFMQLVRDNESGSPSPNPWFRISIKLLGTQNVRTDESMYIFQGIFIDGPKETFEPSWGSPDVVHLIIWSIYISVCPSVASLDHPPIVIFFVWMLKRVDKI